MTTEAKPRLYSTYPFSGIPTFLRSRHLADEAARQDTDYDIAILGVPFDEGMPFRTGTRFGPRGIREQSLRYSDRGYYDFDEEKIYLTRELQEKRIVDLGDVAIVPLDLAGNLSRITESVREVVKAGKFLVAFGGDHSVSAPIVAGYDALGYDFHVVQFDAHPDYSECSEGFEHTNSHPMTHIARLPFVKSLTQVGIRSPRAFSTIDSIADGNRVVGMTEFRKLGPAGVADIIPEGEPVYVTIDIDAYDSPLVPGCVSAEPNGILFAEMRQTLASLAKKHPIVGFDLVEIAPGLDIPTQITSFLGCQTVVEFLGSICDQPYWKKRTNQM